MQGFAFPFKICFSCFIGVDKFFQQIFRWSLTSLQTFSWASNLFENGLIFNFTILLLWTTSKWRQFFKDFYRTFKKHVFWFPLQKRPLYICSFIPNTTIGIYLYFHLIPFDLCIVCGLFTYYSNFSDTKSFQGAIIEGIFLPMLVKPNSVSFRILKNI